MFREFQFSREQVAAVWYGIAETPGKDECHLAAQSRFGPSRRKADLKRGPEGRVCDIRRADRRTLQAGLVRVRYDEDDLCISPVPTETDFEEIGCSEGFRSSSESGTTYDPDSTANNDSC
jgi:hypothetical protein